MPQLSVVIPSVNGLGDLVGCLNALQQQQRDLELEILVVDRCGAPLRQEVARLYPSVRVIAVDVDTSIPAMRAIAFRLARGDYVAVIEDHVIVPPGWSRALYDACRETNAVVGGAVDNAATERLIDWAAFLCEYSHCLPPLPAGPASWLTGNNVVYPRVLLEQYRAETEAGRWENHLHDALRRDGVALVCRPEICVGHKKHYTVKEYLTQRFLYARSYAGTRVASASWLTRIGFGVAALALPPLLMYRTVTRVARKPRYRRELVRSLPLLALFVSSWSAGEVMGYWTGPSNSLAKVC